MSYDLSIYHPDVKQKVDAGFELDAFAHTPLAKADVDSFVERLELYGYQPLETVPAARVFAKTEAESLIRVSLFDTEITFSVSPPEGEEDVLFERLQDASELSDSDGLVLFNWQTGEWTVW